MKKKIITTAPKPFHIPVDRRRFFKSMFAASAGFMLSGYLAEALFAAEPATVVAEQPNTQSELGAMLAEIEQMTDGDVQQLLRRRS